MRLPESQSSRLRFYLHKRAVGAAPPLCQITHSDWSNFELPLAAKSQKHMKEQNFGRTGTRVPHTRDTNCVLTFGKEMETCFSAVFFWIVVFGITTWMLKLLAQVYSWFSHDVIKN